ncbi:MAG TPA: DUF6702 family protein [Salinivirga sp.]|uniref:DUF6702 family protein n=1 Tax=Salinivirga sp. TaxID=1970192 RepID=UPI002B484D78|nr:DUF6702 family protein [Salinivirga sp.]HKK59861.1 DUF6702 family protein [Salinivirga sp.]
MLNILSFVISLMFFHPLHLGVIHFNATEAGQVTINVKVFTDDLENALIHNSNSDFKMNYDNVDAVKDASQYIDSRFDVTQSGSEVSLELLEVGPRRDVTIFKYTATIDSDVAFDVCCSIFYELFNDQTNLLIVNLIDQEDGYRLSSRKTCAHVE